MRPTRVLASSLVTAALLQSATTPTIADRDNRNRQDRRDDDDDRKKRQPPMVIFQSPVIFRAPVAFGGCPPLWWAPAHGYCHRRDGEKVYAAPYGIDRGQ